MNKLNLALTTAITVCPVNTFEDLFATTEDLRKVEGDNLYKQIAKMNVAAGDLAACATEGKDGFPCKHEIADEVAALVMRSIMFGLHHGMKADDLRNGLQREATRLVQMGFSKKINKALEGIGFEQSAPPVQTVVLDDIKSMLGAHCGGMVGGIPPL